MWMQRFLQAGRCSATAVAAVAMSVAVAAAMSAAAPAVRVTDGDVVVPISTRGKWTAPAAPVAAAAAVSPAARGKLPAVGRPLAVGVSVLTDGTYTLDASGASAGCPQSLSVAGPLTTKNGTFSVDSTRLSVGGAGCVGANANSVLFGFFGVGLVDLANEVGLDITTLLEADPQVALAVVLEGPIQCGAVAVEDAFWTFLVNSGTPTLQITGGDELTCTLADRTTGAPPAFLTKGLTPGRLAAVSSTVRTWNDAPADLTRRIGV